MKINKKLDNKELTIELEGRLDSDSAPTLEKELIDLNGVEKLIFNLEKLEYISSAGLRILLYCQKRLTNQGELIIKNANSDIKKILEITGFNHVLTID